MLDRTTDVLRILDRFYYQSPQMKGVTHILRDGSVTHLSLMQINTLYDILNVCDGYSFGVFLLI